MQKNLKNNVKKPDDSHTIAIRTEFWKSKKLKKIAQDQKRSINMMINAWIDREIKKWDKKNAN